MNSIKSPYHLIWIAFPPGCRDCTCVVSRATLTSSWSTSGETGGSRWVSWSPNIYCMKTRMNIWIILTYIDHVWKSMTLLVLLIFWLNIEIDSEEPAPVPFFGQVPTDEMEATAPRIFTRQMKAGPVASGGMCWELEQMWPGYTWILHDDRIFMNLHTTIPNGMEIIDVNRCNRSSDLISIYCHFLVQTCLKNLGLEFCAWMWHRAWWLCDSCSRLGDATLMERAKAVWFFWHNVPCQHWLGTRQEAVLHMS